MAKFAINYSVMAEDGKLYIESAGKSTDTKPVGDFSMGSWAHEVDTKKVYSFDGSDWVEQGTLFE